MSSRKNGILLKILLLLLIACTVLAVGVTYGRYQSSIISASFNVTAVSADSFSIFGGALDPEKMTEAWPELDEGWSMNDLGAELRFFVSNGDSVESYSQRSRNYSIKIVSGSLEQLNVNLSYIDENGNLMELPANPEKINKGSQLYDSFGDGWVYTFLDTNEEEVEFVLEGEKFSYRNFTLNVWGESDPSLLNVIVTGNIVTENS